MRIEDGQTSDIQHNIMEFMWMVKWYLLDILYGIIGYILWYLLDIFEIIENKII